jgi:hypothetical protein
VSDITQVVTLLEEWRDATGLGRVKVGLDAARTIGGLNPARKRELAVEVASRIAPQLVPAITAEKGDLSADQVGAIVDLLRHADREQLDDLVTALRTGDFDGAVGLVDEAVTLVAPAAAISDAPHDPDELHAEHSATEADAPPLPDTADSRSAGRRAARETNDEAERAAAEARAVANAERWRDSSADRIATSAYVLPTMSFSLRDDELPDPTVEEVAPLADRMSELPGVAASEQARARVQPSPQDGAYAAAGLPTDGDTARDTTAHPHTTTMAVAGDVPAEVADAPDGYRRRRAVMAALRDTAITTSQLGALIATLSRPMDRAWVASGAIELGMLRSVDELDSMQLGAAATARLARRIT